LLLLSCRRVMSRLVSLFCCLHVPSPHHIAHDFPVIVIPLPPPTTHESPVFPLFVPAWAELSHVPSRFVPHAVPPPLCPCRLWIRRHHRIFESCFFGWGPTLRSMVACSGWVTRFMSGLSSLRVFSCFTLESYTRKQKRRTLWRYYGPGRSLCLFVWCAFV